ncbi:MAG: hypothetical protein E7448_03800 [Ruminococcaceae bacterium]|nr:hypothetical protein [Oscillospiraceae bacterium]
MADFTEKNVYEALGLGEQVQEPADPAPTAQTPPADPEGVQVQEPADPANDPAANPTGTGTEPSAGTAAPDDPENEAGDGADSGKTPLTPEQRRQNAARRRQQEQEARQAEIDLAVQAAVKAEQDKQAASMVDFFKKAGMVNSFTNEPITNMEQFLAWHQRFDAEKMQRQLQSGKMTPEILEDMIGKHPAMQKVQQLIDQENAAAKQRQIDADKAAIDAEIAAIHELDPSINSVADLLKMPNAKEFYDLVNRGYSFKDAHYLVNRAKLEKARDEAIRQQAMNNVRGKDHLSPTGVSRGKGAASVPAEDMAMFRLLNPGATDQQIQDYYNKHKS